VTDDEINLEIGNYYTVSCRNLWVENPRRPGPPWRRACSGRTPRRWGARHVPHLDVVRGAFVVGPARRGAMGGCCGKDAVVVDPTSARGAGGQDSDEALSPLSPEATGKTDEQCV